MSSTFYCILWIPTLYHSGDFLSVNNILEEDISDNIKAVNHIKIILLENKNILLENRLGNLTLKYKGNSKTGLFQYAIDSIRLKELGFEGSNIPNSVYHLIKKLYHYHEHHTEKADSLLTPFKSETLIKLDSDNNLALIHYLKIYQDKFKFYSDDVAEKYNKLLENSTKKSFKSKNVEAHRNIEKVCQSALGEYLYCNTLLNSKYLRIDNSDALCSDQRKRVLNIRNSIGNIKLIDSKNQTEFRYSNARASSRINAMGLSFTIAGVVFSIIGLYSIYLSIKTPSYAKTILNNEEQIKIQVKCQYEDLKNEVLKLKPSNTVSPLSAPLVSQKKETLQKKRR